MTAPATILDAAADLLERDGWCQNRRRDSNGCRCLTKALIDANHAAGRTYLWQDVTHPVVEVILPEMHPRFRYMDDITVLELWNDEVATSREQVVAVLCRAAWAAEGPVVDAGVILQRAFGQSAPRPHLTVVAP